MIKSIKLFLKRLEENNTIMLIPHNEKSIKNIHLSNSFLYLFIFFITIILMVSSFFLIKYSIHSKELERLSKFHAINQKNKFIFNKQLESLNDQIAQLSTDMETFSVFEKKELYGIGGLELDYGELNSNMQKLFDDKFFPTNSIYDMLEENSAFLNQSHLLSKEMLRFFQKRNDFMQSLPILWPVANKKGNIKNSKNKFDIILIGGEDVIVSGSGRVDKIGLNEKGIFIFIHHGYGIFSEYRGLQKTFVNVGEEMVRGTSLGLAGDLMTYRIKIASKYVDPRLFTIIR